jgi:hypothetical protein
VVASRETNQQNIPSRCSKTAREDCAVLTDCSEIRRQPVDKIEELVTLLARSLSNTRPHRITHILLLGRSTGTTRIQWKEEHCTEAAKLLAFLGSSSPN